MILMRAWILAVLILLSFPLVQAQFSLEVSEPQPVLAGKTANFTITISSQAEDWFSIAVVGTQPSWISLEKFNVKIPYNGKGTVNVFISPSYDALQGVYGYTVIVSDMNGTKAEKNVLVSVIQKLSAVLKDIKLTCPLCKPGETLSVSAIAENIGSRNLENLQALISFDDTKKTVLMERLDALTKKTVSADFVLSDVMPPGEYNVKLQLLRNGEILDEKTESFSVPAISDVKTDRKVSSSIFGKSVTLTTTNAGNIQTQAEIKSAVSKEWFVSYSGPAPSQKNGEYVWLIALNPKESKQIKYSEIYWTTYLIIAVLLLGGALFYLQMTALSIRKKVLHKRAAIEGRELSVSIDVKNRGGTLENIVVRDKVPTMFEIVGKFETLKPTIRKTENESELIWKLGRLKPKEERVLHYKIKTIVGVIGAIALPRAAVSGKAGEKTIIRKSNTVYLRGIKEK